jgi:hypothetical protein
MTKKKKPRKPRTEVKGVVVNVYVTTDQHKRITAHAKSGGMSASGLMRQLALAAVDAK